jgi:hypothetical protein
MENPFKQEYYKNIPEKNIEEIYRNPRLRLPFDPKDLVMFLDRRAEGTESEKARRLRTIPYHHRSADLGITTPIHEQFPAKEGKQGMHHVYTQVDIKGSGFVYPEEHESKKHGMSAGELAGSPEAVFVPESVETPMGYDILGLLDAGMIQTTIEKSRYLAAKGMRTEAVAGVYGIDVIRMDGKDTSVKEFKKEAILILQEQLKELIKGENDAEIQTIKEKITSLKSEDGFRPAIEVRCMRSVLRLRDLKDAPVESRLELIREAIKSLNIEMQYLGEGQRFDSESPEGLKEWMEFVTFWIGKNTGIMHREGLAHEFLHMGNLTMAGEIVDLDSVQSVIKTGKGEGKSFENEPFFRRNAEGYSYINPGVGMHRLPDERFGLPKCLIKDLRDVCFSFRMLLKNIPQLKKKLDSHLLAQKMYEGYVEGLGDAETSLAIGISGDSLLTVMESIAKEVIGNGAYYAPIPADDAEKSVE